MNYLERAACFLMTGRPHPDLPHPKFHHQYQGLLKDGLFLIIGFHGSFTEGFFSSKISSSMDLSCNGSTGFFCMPEESVIMIFFTNKKSDRI